MRTSNLVAAILVPAALVFAQAQKPAAAAPSGPKTAAHEALAMFAGDWDMTMESKAMPGVPGMEQDRTTSGREHAELICNGLFLLATMDATVGGTPFQGVFVVGHDAAAGHYTGHWVDSMECAPMLMTGDYEPAQKRWRWSGTTAQGRMRTELVLQADGSTVETCWLVAGDGKETQCSKVTRRRHSGAVAASATAVPTDASLSAEHKLLQQDLGDWTAAVTIEMGGRTLKSTATERVRSLCGGHWTWSDYRGELMGQAFEAHALTGYDPAKKEVVGFWFDGPIVSATTGAFDAAGKVRTMTGSSVGRDGKAQQMKKVMTYRGADARTLRSEFEGGGRSGAMTIDYTRQKQ